MKLTAAGLGVFAVVLVATAVGGVRWYRQRAVVEVRPEPVRVLEPVVRVSEAELSVDGKRLLALGSLEDQATRGIDAQFKARGPNDLRIVPLVAALENRRAPGALAGPLTIELAPRSPYRVMVEVLFSAGQSGAEGFLLSMPAIGTHAANELQSDLPRVMDGSSYISIFIVRDGLSVKHQGRNVAPGCEEHGPGVAVPQANGYDLAGLVACLKRLNSDPNTAVRLGVVLANPGIEAATVLEVASTLRCGEPRCRGRQLGLPFVAQVNFALPR